MEYFTALEMMSTYAETRGVIYTAGSDGELIGMEGWFRLSDDRQTVYARRIRGRNTWRYATAAAVVQFDRTHY